MRFGFVTCVRLGLACLEEVYAIGGKVDAIFTLGDDVAPSKSGRVHLDEFAEQHGAPLHKIANINDDDAIEALCTTDLDWLFIIGWSQIAGADVLTAPRLGCVGMHPTLLPRGRGRASIPWAILKGLDETGVTMFKLDESVDSGPVIAQERIPLSAHETATTLYRKVTAAHQTLMRLQFPRLAAGTAVMSPQDEAEATVWPGRTPEHGRISALMQVSEVDRLVRATTRPYPGAFLESGGRRTIVWAGGTKWTSGARRISCADGAYFAYEFEQDAWPQ